MPTPELAPEVTPEVVEVVEIFRTIVVPADEQAEAQAIAAEYPGGAGMFTTACSPTGDLPATDYISSGMLSVEIVDALAAAIPTADISEEPPFVALDRLGLKLVTANE
jgi:hypothetical protein